MSNVKEVYLLVEVPFNLFDDPMHGGKLEADDFSFFCRMFLSPSGGIKWTSNGRTRWEDNKNGGQTAIDQVVIEGHEAVSFKALERLVGCIKKVGGNVLQGWGVDIEDRSGGPVIYS